MPIVLIPSSIARQSLNDRADYYYMPRPVSSSVVAQPNAIRGRPLST